MAVMGSEHHFYNGKYDVQMKEMIDKGFTAYRINKTLQEQGAKISPMTVYRRVAKLKSQSM